HNRRITGIVRTLENRWAAAVCPRYVKEMSEPGKFPVGGIWADTEIRLPDGDSLSTDWFTGKQYRQKTIPLRDLLNHFPIALLVGGED
ncbi:MAG: hypothetical protein ACOC0U_02005, partial [Desulfovibrionales bacterium]